MRFSLSRFPIPPPPPPPPPPPARLEWDEGLKTLIHHTPLSTRY